MRGSTTHAPNSEIEQIVRALLQEDANYDNAENRSAHREHLVRSVIIQTRRPAVEEISAFSRNISASGIGLITRVPIADRTIAILTIERLKDVNAKILAECRWCRSYGDNWQISGWNFINAQN